MCQVVIIHIDLRNQLLRDRRLKLPPRQAILERMGGYPKILLDGPANLSDRDVRKQIIQTKIQAKYHQSQQPHIQEVQKRLPSYLSRSFRVTNRALP